MTNADCIRRMNDEQLYDFLSEWECGDIDYSITFCDLCKQGGNELNLDCDGCRKHWLQRDAVEYGGLMYWKRNTVFDTADRKTEPTISKMEQVDKDINVRSKDEPQTEDDKKHCVFCKWVYEPNVCGRCRNMNLFADAIEDEPQTDCSWK